MTLNHSLSERAPLLSPTSPSTPVLTYKRRWYILALFSLLAVLQDAIWNTWGPIDHTAKIAYGWSDDLIALLANYGSIMYVVAFIPAVYSIEKDLRTAMLWCSGFMALGTILRCGLLQDPYVSDAVFTVSCHICSILNGISNIVIGSAPLAISAAWFPPHERVTATSIGQVFNGLGTGMSFLLASQIVRPIDNLDPNVTLNSSSSVEYIPPAELENIKRDIQWYMYSNAIPAGLFFLLVCVYFPRAPPSPPSVSSGHQRLDFISGFREIAKKPAAWIIAIGASIPQAIVIAWTAMMVVNLTHVCSHGDCLTQHWVNYLGIYAAVASTVAAVLVARASDMIRGCLKLTIITLLGLASIVFTFLCLISIDVIHFESIFAVKAWVLVLLLLGNSLVVATMPLAMELAMEICYPAAEGVVGGWITIWFNLITVIFLSLFSIPGIGSTWLDYVLPLSCLLALPLMAAVKEEYNRTSVDQAAEKEEEVVEP